MWSTACARLSGSEASGPKRYAVHDAARHECEQAGDDKPAGEYADHGPAVVPDFMPARAPDCKRQHHQRKDRQQMDRAPWSPKADFMDEKGGDADDHHDRNPEPAEGAVVDGAFRRRQLNDAERES